MSSGHPLASSEASVARIAVKSHPLAATTMTASVGSQSDRVSPPRSQRKQQQKDVMGATSFAAVTSSSPPITTIPQYSPSVLASEGDAIISPSSKSLDTLADDFLSSKSPPARLRPNPLPRGEVGIVRLRTLVERRAWGDVLKLASSLLNNNGVGKRKSTPSSKNKQYSEVYASLLFSEQDNVAQAIEKVPYDVKQETTEILMLLCTAMLKLRRYADLSKEVGRWKFLRQNDVTAPSVEWLPWGIHILAGQSREYSGDIKQATLILCRLREEIPPVECGWIASLDNALANIYIRRGEWRLALGCFDRIIDLIPELVTAEVRNFLDVDRTSVDVQNEDKMVSFFTTVYICEILSREGRIFLQVGAILEAREVFGAAKSAWSKVESSLSFSLVHLAEEFSHRSIAMRLKMESLLELNDGLLSFSESNYNDALHSFSNAIEILKQDDSSFHSQYCKQDWIGPAIVERKATSLLYNEVVNNASLCNLYMCNMKGAVIALEELVRGNPTAFLTERVAFNLCTLYELGTDSAVATRKKRVLQLIAKRFFLHDVGPESFRVS